MLPLEQSKVLSEFAINLDTKKIKSHKKVINTGKKERVLFIPNKWTKSKQRELIAILEHIYLPSNIYSKRGGSYIDLVRDISTYDNVMCIDIKDFFPSLHHSKVTTLWNGFGLPYKEIAKLTYLTTRDYHVPLGYCTSPIISNLLFNSVDLSLLDWSKKRGLQYGRYVDDIFIYGNSNILSLLSHLVRILTKQGYSLKKEKIKYFNATDVKKILGIDIVDGNTRVSPAYLDSLKEEIKILEQVVKLTEDIDHYKDSIHSTRGKLSFLRSIDAKEYASSMDKINNQILLSELS